MRLLLVNSAVPELWGGGEKWFVEAAKWFTREGHSVMLCARTDSKLFLAAVDAGVSAVATPFGGDFDPFAISRAHKILKQIKPECVLTNFNKEAWHFGFARDKMDTRLIARHGFPLWNNKLHHRVVAKLLDHVIVNAEPIRNHYLTLGIQEKKITVIPNGVSPVGQHAGKLRKRLELSDNVFLAVAAGRLEQQKRFDLLLKAWKTATLNPSDAHLAIFGRGPDEESLRALVRDLNLESRVTLEGFEPEFASLIGDADLYLLTSENEGTPNAVLEAMSAGVPVLGFDVGAMNRILADELNEFLIPGGDTDKLTERLAHWISNVTELRTRRNLFAARAQHEFCFDASMRRYFNVIETIVRSNERVA